MSIVKCKECKHIIAVVGIIEKSDYVCEECRKKRNKKLGYDPDLLPNINYSVEDLGV